MFEIIICAVLFAAAKALYALIFIDQKSSL